MKINCETSRLAVETPSSTPIYHKSVREMNNFYLSFQNTTTKTFHVIRQDCFIYFSFNMRLVHHIKAYYKCDTHVNGTERKKITTALDSPYMANAETTCRRVSVVLKHVLYHKQEAAVVCTTVKHIAAVNNLTNLLPARVLIAIWRLDCYAA